MSKSKIIMLILLGVLVAVAIFSVVVCVGCSVNGITFGQQISNWFGKSDTATTETVVDTVEEMALMFKF